MTYQISVNPIETAMTLSNEFAPLVVVTCLRMTTLPEKKIMTKALEVLQKRHPFLKARIIFEGSKTVFEIDENCPNLILTEDNFSNKTERNQHIENELNQYFNPRQGGLMRCRILKDNNSEGGEILLTFHHAVIDGVSARLILHEFLTLSGNENLRAPMSEKRFLKKRKELSLPSGFTGFSLMRKLFAFAGSQMKEEFSFRFQNRGQKIPKPATDSKNKILSVQFSERETEQILAFSKKSGIGMNSLISAAMLKATFEQKFAGASKRMMRATIFANLRPFMNPRISNNELGNYTSMMRFSLPVYMGLNSRKLGSQIHSAVFKSGKTGAIFLFYFMVSKMVRVLLKLKNMRISDTALSYIDVLDLKKNYGTLELEAVHAFITNNRFGPLFSGFGKILFGQLCLDFNYLPSETSDEKAKAIATQIRGELIKVSEPGTPL